MSQVYNVIFGINPELQELHDAFNQEIGKIWADCTNVEVMGKYGLGDKSWFTPPPRARTCATASTGPRTGWRRTAITASERPPLRARGRRWTEGHPGPLSSARLKPRGRAMDPLLRIVDLHKSFGALEVLKGVSIEVARGEKLSIIGPSGSGKTTLLRCVNYLEKPTSGHVYVDGALIGEKQVNGRFVHLSDRELRASAPRSASCFSASTCFRI